MKPVLFDTDIGSDCDDAVALGLILACPDALELVAVTTVSSDTRKRAEIAAWLEERAQRYDEKLRRRGAVGYEKAPDGRDRRRRSDELARLPDHGGHLRHHAGRGR